MAWEPGELKVRNFEALALGFLEVEIWWWRVDWNILYHLPGSYPFFIISRGRPIHSREPVTRECLSAGLGTCGYGTQAAPPLPRLPTWARPLRRRRARPGG